MVNAPEHRGKAYISTGRGGAANFRKSNTLSQKLEVAPRSTAQFTDSDCELTRIATQASLGARFATGRGGAGNILPSGQAPVPAETTPATSQPRLYVPTGRGGAGNFKNSASGRSVSFSGPSSKTTAKTADTPMWASRVTRIDAGLHDGDGTLARNSNRSGSFSSTNSAPAGITLFGRMRRRLSSFSNAAE